MNFAERFENIFKKLLPAPFTIAVLLTLFTIVLALIFTPSQGGNHFAEVLGYWEKGLWSNSLLVFALQMMLILVLGHVLALSPISNRLINSITQIAHTSIKATWLVTFFTLLVAFFNWGLGLIFGAIIARKIGEKFAKEGKQLNYALIGASGYSGFMVWHGGISGSAPGKVAEEGHLQSLMEGIYTPAQQANLPTSIPFNETIFSSMNIVISISLLLVIPLFMAWLAKVSPVKKVVFPVYSDQTKVEKPNTISGAEKLDHSRILCLGFASIILGYALYIPLSMPTFNLSFITFNFINLTLLGLALAAHGSFSNFLRAIDQAISGSSGILIQFPLYFGILGIMKYSGLIDQISSLFTSISTLSSFPVLAFFSAGLVNFFVPSGGGQWSIQGPIIIQAAQQLGVGLPKGIMAMSYGDQLTNMLQPFWALPLLGITGLKARDIIPYTLLLMLVGMLIFLSGLLLF